MDRISELSDELLIKILLLLPTKVAVSTSLLSKRWECLWMWLPKLEYSTSHYSDSANGSLRCLFDRNMALHRAPVIESLCLEFSRTHFRPQDVKLCVLAAVSHIIHELNISYFCHPPEPNVLPSSLFASKSLVILKLSGKIVLDVPRFVCLDSLKTLQLKHVLFLNHGSFQRLLSICPVLKHLSVNRCKNDNMGNFTVKIRSLQSLSIDIPYRCDLDWFVIDTPSLELFNVSDNSYKGHYCLIENMPKLMEAHLEVGFLNITSLIRSITSVKHLTICSWSEPMYGDGFVFNQLEHLSLCARGEYMSNLLGRMLKDAPNLRVLDLSVMDGHEDHENMAWWNQPSTVPECLLSNLQTFIWSGYEGTPQERDLVIYILKYARHLKTTTIKSWEEHVPKLQMLRELSLSSRGSTMCQLEFD